ncbi:MAG: patatin-like phospholipase family protein [Actinobacteria bacterium]|nr:patatin-like phospholipase family protein [Actinomycetota bacterium]
MTESRRSPARRGLVLGGGGVLGGAWAVGALEAIEEVHGIDPRDFDIIVGTSAGSVLGALVAAGVSIEALRDHQRGVPITEGPLAGYLWDYETATGGRRPSMPRLRGPGSVRLMASSLRHGLKMPPTAVLSAFLPVGNGSLERVGHLIDAITPFGEWSPHRSLWVVAMDYEAGHRVVFGRDDAPRASLADAVMASCAIPGWFEPVTIDERTYVDGGAWSATSADVLAGHGLDEVYVVAPMVSFETDEPDSLLSRLERRWRGSVTRRCEGEVAELRDEGVQVTVLGPGREDLEAMGGNIMDGRRRLEVLETSLRTSRVALESGGSGRLADTG